MSVDENAVINHQNQRHTIKFTVSASILRQDLNFRFFSVFSVSLSLEKKAFHLIL